MHFTEGSNNMRETASMKATMQQVTCGVCSFDTKPFRLVRFDGMCKDGQGDEELLLAWPELDHFWARLFSYAR